MGQTFSDDDIQVIMALSNLYLDTDVSEFYEYIVEECNAAGIGRDRIEELLFQHVAPALTVNLECVAGEWDGFDESWVMERITTQDKPSITNWLQRRLRRAYAKRHWSHIRLHLTD